MNPLPDRTVVIGLVATLGMVFALVFWFVRLTPSQEPPLLWRQTAPPERREQGDQHKPSGPLIRTLPNDQKPAALI